MARAETLAPDGTSAVAWATDIRFGVLLGKTFWDVWTPYMGVRLFGGPIFWERAGAEISGSDRYHLQIAFGSTIALPEGFSLYVDVSPVGERSVSAGLGWSFGGSEPAAPPEPEPLPVVWGEDR